MYIHAYINTLVYILYTVYIMDGKNPNGKNYQRINSNREKADSSARIYLIFFANPYLIFENNAKLIFFV